MESKKEPGKPSSFTSASSLRLLDQVRARNFLVHFSIQPGSVLKDWIRRFLPCFDKRDGDVSRPFRRVAPCEGMSEAMRCGGVSVSRLAGFRHMAGLEGRGGSAYPAGGCWLGNHLISDSARVIKWSRRGKATPPGLPLSGEGKSLSMLVVRPHAVYLRGVMAFRETNPSAI